jgi:DNA helicase II / ATP-dependent DNA helicase PcrA
MVAREISVRRFAEKLAWNDFAILYRTNLQSRPLEEALRAANIPYRVIGGTSYFDRKEIADAVAYLRVVLNPRDEVSVRRIINYPTRGIGRTTLLRLVDDARAQGRPLWETLQQVESVEGVTGAQAAAVQRFVSMMDRARAEYEAIAADPRPPAQWPGPLEGWVREFLGSLRLEDAIRAENASDRAAEIRVENLRDLTSSVGTFESRTWNEQPLPDEEADWEPPSLRGFVERVSLVNETEEDSRKEKETEGDQVTLLTLHSAKGLEFAHVFLVGMEEEILPHARTVAEVAERPDAPDPLAEERRLFYVGITRARHRLTLSGCRTRRRGGEALPRQPSRFLKEVPPDLVEIRSPGAASSLNEDDRQQLKSNFFSHMREMLNQ